MTSDNVLFGLGVGSEIVLLTVLLQQKVYKTLPTLTGYMIYLIVSDPTLYACYMVLTKIEVEKLYVLAIIPDYAFQTGIILELIAAVAAPIKSHIPRMISIYIYSSIFCSLLVAIAISSSEKFAGYDPLDRLGLKWSLGFAVFRVVALLVLLIVIRLLGVGWQGKAARVAVGISFYAIVVLLVNVAHELGGAAAAGQAIFANWDRVGVAGWVGTLLYLSFYLSRKERVTPHVADRSSRLLMTIYPRKSK